MNDLEATVWLPPEAHSTNVHQPGFKCLSSLGMNYSCHPYPEEKVLVLKPCVTLFETGATKEGIEVK